MNPGSRAASRQDAVPKYRSTEVPKYRRFSSVRHRPPPISTCPRVRRALSAGARTVGRMTNQVQITLEHDVLGEPCPRCGSTAVRAVVYATSVEVLNESTDAPSDAFDADEPLFDCRECGFEWGELIRDLMR